MSTIGHNGMGADCLNERKPKRKPENGESESSEDGEERRVVVQRYIHTFKSWAATIPIPLPTNLAGATPLISTPFF